MTRTAKPELTVAEAAALTRKSHDTIYRWIRAEKLEAIETTDGLVVDTAAVLAVAAGVKPGRPRGG